MYLNLSRKNPSSWFQCCGNGFVEAMVKLCVVYVPEFEQKKAILVWMLWKWFHSSNCKITLLAFFTWQQYSCCSFTLVFSLRIRHVATVKLEILMTCPPWFTAQRKLFAYTSSHHEWPTSFPTRIGVWDRLQSVVLEYLHCLTSNWK